MKTPGRFFVSSFVLAGLLGATSEAMAFRNAQFPDELKSQTTLFTREVDFFNQEPAAKQDRPIWVHGGDSLSVAWGSRDSLRDRLEKEAPTKELPAAGSFLDLVMHMPSQDYSWHTGRLLNFGFLNWLQTETHQEWVIVSTALAGTLFDEEDFDPLKLMTDTVHLDRVKLVTFSLGANDLCANHNPLDNRASFDTRTDAFKAAFPADATIVPWSVPNVKQVRAGILARLDQVPDSLAKRRVVEYCMAAWEHHCPAAAADSQAEIDAIRLPLVAAYEQKFGKTFDVFNEVTQTMTDPLDLMSSDCFHPSRDVQEGIYKSLAKHVKDYYRLSLDGSSVGRKN